MLKVEEFDEAGKGITARTRQVELLAQVAADTGMLHAEIYVDGRSRRGLREAMVARFGEPSAGWFRVVHRDPGLRALDSPPNNLIIFAPNSVISYSQIAWKITRESPAKSGQITEKEEAK